MFRALGLGEQARRGFELVRVAVAAIRLGLTQFGKILFAAAMQAQFLDMQIAELLFVGEMCVKVAKRRT